MSNTTEVLCFDKHWDKYCTLSNCKEYEARFHFQSGQQSKQGEVDKLQTEIDELKKLIDLALEKCYTGIRKQGGDYYLELVQNILRGDQV